MALKFGLAVRAPNTLYPAKNSNPEAYEILKLTTQQFSEALNTFLCEHGDGPAAELIRTGMRGTVEGYLGIVRGEPVGDP